MSLDFANVLTLSQKEVRDATRNQWFLLYTLAFVALSLALSWLGLSGLGTFGLAGFGRTGASLVNLVLLIVPLMGLTIGALSLAGEREAGSLLYLLAQPVNTYEVLLGKFAGGAVALFNALVIGFGLSGLLIAWQGGTADLGAYLGLVAFAYLLALACLSLGLLISVLANRVATAIGAALFLWLVLVFFGDLGLMGTAIVLKLKVGSLLTLALLNPLQVFKIAAIWNIRDSLEALGPAGLYAVRTFSNSFPYIMGAILGGWILTPLAAAAWIFHKKGGTR
jgi:Cu-processing system permease protein